MKKTYKSCNKITLSLCLAIYINILLACQYVLQIGLFVRYSFLVNMRQINKYTSVKASFDTFYPTKSTIETSKFSQQFEAHLKASQ